MRPIEIPYSPDPYIPSLGVSHSFLCVNKKDCGGQKLGGLSGEGAPSSDTINKGRSCKRQPPPGDKDNCFDNCVLGFITSEERPEYYSVNVKKIYAPRGLGLPYVPSVSISTHTCHDYVASVLSKCQDRCRGR